MLKNLEKLSLWIKWKAWVQGNDTGGNDATTTFREINYASDLNSRGVICPDGMLL